MSLVIFGIVWPLSHQRFIIPLYTCNIVCTFPSAPVPAASPCSCRSIRCHPNGSHAHRRSLIKLYSVSVESNGQTVPYTVGRFESKERKKGRCDTGGAESFIIYRKCKDLEGLVYRSEHAATVLKQAQNPSGAVPADGWAVRHDMTCVCWENQQRARLTTSVVARLGNRDES